MDNQKHIRAFFLILFAVGLLNVPSLRAQPGDIFPSEIDVNQFIANGHQFEQLLPIPAEIDVTTNNSTITMYMSNTSQWLGLFDNSGQMVMTDVWGYGLSQGSVSYPGPTLRAQKNKRVFVKWRNKLPNSHLLPVDYSLHMATISNNKGIPAVPHLHGGHTESDSDGLPEAWFTRSNAAGSSQLTGNYYVKQNYVYDNDQEAATLWYHDHALGITRLNVYAGLAGFYLLEDNNENHLISTNVLPQREFEIEVVVQDRSFGADGELILPTEVESEGDCIVGGPVEPDGDPIINAPGELPVPAVSAVAEYFGDFIIVNGKAWPKLNVEPRKYRIRLLNGSDSRFYIFNFDKPVPVYQIGSDNGLLPLVQPATVITSGPGERYDLVMDFSNFAGQEIIMQNWGPDEPFKGFNFDQDVNRSTGKIMKFVVGESASSVPDASVEVGTRLRPNINGMPQTGPTRELALFEGRDQYCRLRPQLGTIADGSLMWDDAITENPQKNKVEVWEVYNATEDAHPVHLHLVSFQVIGRGTFNGYVTYDPNGGDPAHGGGSKSFLTITQKGYAAPLNYNQTGWKDTEIVYPGQYVRLRAKFDREGRYVWHCHILSHEDHEMMRPFYVGNLPAPFASVNPDDVIQTKDEQALVTPQLAYNAPNPFSDQTQIHMMLPESTRLTVEVFDLAGNLVTTLANGSYDSGEHILNWNGRSEGGAQLANGVYTCRLKTQDGFTHSMRMMVMR